METCLPTLVLHITPVLILQIEKHFGKHTQHREIVDLVSYFVGRAYWDREETTVGDVDGGSVAMCGIGDGIGIAALEVLDVIGCAKQGGDNEFVRLNALGDERVNEIDADGGEKMTCTGSEVGDGMAQTVDNIERRVAHIDKLMVVDVALGLVARMEWRNTVEFGSSKLKVVHVGEILGETMHTVNLVLSDKIERSVGNFFSHNIFLRSRRFRRFELHGRLLRILNRRVHKEMTEKRCDGDEDDKEEQKFFFAVFANYSVYGTVH